MQYFDQYVTTLNASLTKIDLQLVMQLRQWLLETRENSGSIYICGNGGSAATASHFATDLGKGASYGQDKRFRVFALTDSFSTVSAYSNDVDYAVVFEEQLRNVLSPTDVVVAISGSGNSENVVRALNYANGQNAKSVAFTGRDGGELGAIAQLHINVPEQHMGRIEDAHMALCHMLAFSFIDQQGQ